MIRSETLAEGVTLYCGNCLDVLPTIGTVDHVITDPPYEQISQDRIGGIKRNDGGRVTAKLSFPGIDAIRDDVAALIRKQCQGWALLFCTAEGVALWRDAIERHGLKYKTPMIWVKPDAMPKFNGQGPALAYENIVSAWCGAGHSSWNGGGKRGVFTCLTNHPDRQGEHPTEKPVPLMNDLVVLFTRPGDLVCDPFCGSGTTGIAAVKNGRRFVGIEADPLWFDLSCRRISEALKQPDFFIDRPAPAKQEALL